MALAWDNQVVNDVLDEALTDARRLDEPDVGCAIERACARLHADPSESERLCVPLPRPNASTYAEAWASFAPDLAEVAGALLCPR